MSNSPFAHSHALHVVIPTTSDESIPQTPAERTTFHNASFTNPDVAPDPDNGSTNTRVQHDADTVFNDPANSHALATVPSTPPAPISPRGSRRATRTGSLFSVGADHEEREDDGKGDFIAEAAMMLGVMAGHLVAGYMGHEEPSSEKDGHDGDEKENA